MATTSGIIILALAARTILPIARVYYLIFGILTIMGGVMGYVKAKSIVSIISGTISGLVLIGASYLLMEHPIAAEVSGLCVSVLLAGKFVPDYIHKKAFVPGGLMAVLSALGIVASILALVSIR